MFILSLFMSISLVSCGDDEPDNENSVTGRDALSNTSWTITSMTGWGKDDYSEFKGMVLSFGTNGEISAVYSDGYKDSGSYTLSGSTLSMTGMSFLTNRWGPTYAYHISGNQLTLVACEGRYDETKFIFQKK